MAGRTVFVVSGDSAIRDSVSELIASANLSVETFSCLAAWLEAVPRDDQGCLVLDAGALELAGPDPLACFTSVCARHPVVLLVDRGDVPAAVRAIRCGAVSVLEKPCRNDTLLESIERAAAADRDDS